uniref:Lysozyme inhibitor LprI N-terminal domain-containing protein n=1 Tax=Magnetococcus massalia (strain MO-1) TaxID=451514 RepID=A0A1S7LKA1_MAGMO|nr:Exported protein of unknown function [Candidatus Magnetococcus massalia]
MLKRTMLMAGLILAATVGLTPATVTEVAAANKALCKKLDTQAAQTTAYYNKNYKANLKNAQTLQSWIDDSAESVAKAEKSGCSYRSYKNLKDLKAWNKWFKGKIRYATKSSGSSSKATPKRIHQRSSCAEINAYSKATVSELRKSYRTLQNDATKLHKKVKLVKRVDYYAKQKDCKERYTYKLIKWLPWLEKNESKASAKKAKKSGRCGRLETRIISNLTWYSDNHKSVVGNPYKLKQWASAISSETSGNSLNQCLPKFSSKGKKAAKDLKKWGEWAEKESKKPAKKSAKKNASSTKKMSCSGYQKQFNKEVLTIEKTYDKNKYSAQVIAQLREQVKKHQSTLGTLSSCKSVSQTFSRIFNRLALCTGQNIYHLPVIAGT